MSIIQTPFQLYTPGLTIVRSDITLVRAPSLMAAGADAEEATYQQGTITNGYGQASGVYVTVQKGTSADVNIDFSITTLSEESFKEITVRARQYFRQDQWSTLQQGQSYEQAGSWFTRAFGLGFRQSSESFVNGGGTFESQNDEQMESFARDVYNLETKQFRVTGRLRAEGTSFIPVTVSAYVQVTNITFADGRQLKVINSSNPVAADSAGSTQGASTDATQLKVVPL